MGTQPTQDARRYDELMKRNMDAIGLMTRTGAIADTINRARHFGEIARDALAPLGDTPQKAALLDVIAFCVSRVS